VANRAKYSNTHELPQPQKIDNRLVAVRAENKMASVGSSHMGYATIGILQLSQSNMPRDKSELEAES
jgi:hypothetical protein